MVFASVAIFPSSVRPFAVFWIAITGDYTSIAARIKGAPSNDYIQLAPVLLCRAHNMDQI